MRAKGATGQLLACALLQAEDAQDGTARSARMEHPPRLRHAEAPNLEEGLQRLVVRESKFIITRVLHVRRLVLWAIYRLKRNALSGTVYAYASNPVVT